MRKLIAAATIVAAGVGIGGNVFAGEVTGNGDPTPIARPEEGGKSAASSECAFNGLDDGSETTPPTAVEPGVVQSFGSIVAGEAKAAGGVGAFAQQIRLFGPGTNCRGYLLHD